MIWSMTEWNSLYNISNSPLCQLFKGSGPSPSKTKSPVPSDSVLLIPVPQLPRPNFLAEARSWQHKWHSQGWAVILYWSNFRGLHSRARFKWDKTRWEWRTLVQLLGKIQEKMVRDYSVPLGKVSNSTKFWFFSRKIKKNNTTQDFFWLVLYM